MAKGEERGLDTQTIKRFRGINAFESVTMLGPEWAQDCLNVVVASTGRVSKLRLPVTLTPAAGATVTGPDSFWDFQQPNGTRQIFATFGQSLYYYDTGFTVAHLIETSATDVGPWSAVELQNFLFMANGQRMLKWTGTALQNIGIAVPTLVPALVLVAGAMAGTYQYSYAGKNSITGALSNRTVAQGITPAGNNVQATANAADPALSDPQVDVIVWYRSLIGGGLLFRLTEQNKATAATQTLNTGTVAGVFAGANYRITDANTPDAALDQLTQGSLINSPPIQGKYLCSGQGRLAVMNLTGDPQGIIYSGIEQILNGNPVESFPPGNRLRVNAGAEEIAGGGFLQNGLVAMSSTGRIFMARGTLQDITTSAPVNFTSYLDELPWALGLFSHLTIQSTPYGLLWLAGDKTLQLFDGSSRPQDISKPVYPLLRAITPGTESKCVGAYFNWLDRDMYALTCCVAGSQVQNAIIFWSFDPDSEGIDIFPSSLIATFMNVVTTANKQRLLCLANGQGRIQYIPLQGDTTGGITKDFTINPPTEGILPAYWVSGYFGNDTPQRTKMWRYINLITDQDAGAFQLVYRLVDNLYRRIADPEIGQPITPTIPRSGINKKATRFSVEIDFPSKDVPANMLEMQVASIPTADR